MARKPAEQGGAAAASSGLKRGAPRNLKRERNERRVKLTVPSVNTCPAPRLSVFVLSAISILFVAQNNPAALVQPQSQTLEDCVEKLARKVLATPHEHRVSLVWANRAGISESRAESLRVLFVARLEAAQVHFAQGEAAPALRVAIEQTPSQIVFTATVPAEGTTNTVMEQAPRAQVGLEGRSAPAVRLEKELLWQQEVKILSAALSGSPAANQTDGERGRKMFVLTEDALVVYEREPETWKELGTKPLPVRQPPRGARGQVLFAEDNDRQVLLLLPGRRCDADWTGDAAMICAAAKNEWRSGRLLVQPACGTQTYWLKSDSTDWTSEDRLQILPAGAANESKAVAEIAVPGPVISVSAGNDAGSAAVVARNLSTGNYEVYRVALACGN